MTQDYSEWMRIAEAQQRGSSGHDTGGCKALFYTRPMLDAKATELEGRPIYNSVPFVEIRIPGDPRSVVDERVNDEHKRRWPQAWEAYERKQSGPVDGTPIEEFPLLTTTLVATLKHCGVHTVEQLANVSDANLRNLGPDGMKLRERAKQHLQGPKETERELRARIQKLEEQNSDLTAKLHQLMHAVSSDGHDDHDEAIADGVAAAIRRPRRKVA